MKTEDVLLGDVPVHIGVPTDAGRHPAVVLIGQTPSAQGQLIHTADLLSSLEYVTLAFPLLAQPLDAALLKARLAAAIALLNQRSDVTRGNIAVWSFGAAAGAIAATVPGLSAAIILHLDGDAGAAGDWRPAPPFEARDIGCPVLLIFATSRPDAEEVVERLRGDFASAGNAVETQLYDAPAAQTGVTMESFPANVVADRWDHVQAFLRRYAPAAKPV